MNFAQTQSTMISKNSFKNVLCYQLKTRIEVLSEEINKILSEEINKMH